MFILTRKIKKIMLMSHFSLFKITLFNDLEVKVKTIQLHNIVTYFYGEQISHRFV